MAMPPQQLTPTTWLLIAMTLLTKLLPYATLPPPATAPELRIFWPARNVTLPVATPNASAAPAPDGAHAAAPRCCVETGQCATASLLLRRLAPWLPLNASSTRAAAAATKPLLRGVRPVAPFFDYEDNETEEEWMAKLRVKEEKRDRIRYGIPDSIPHNSAEWNSRVHRQTLEDLWRARKGIPQGPVYTVPLASTRILAASPSQGPQSFKAPSANFKVPSADFKVPLASGLPNPVDKTEKEDDSAKDQMALWKQWMTIEDKASFGRDEYHCRKTPLPWMKQWHCLWDTAYWGPHGFLFGTNEESKEEATDLKTCARRPAADRPRACRRPARARAPARPPARRRVADRRPATVAGATATSGGSSSAPRTSRRPRTRTSAFWRTRSNPPTWRGG